MPFVRNGINARRNRMGKEGRGGKRRACEKLVRATKGTKTFSRGRTRVNSARGLILKTCFPDCCYGNENVRPHVPLILKVRLNLEEGENKGAARAERRGG